MMPNSSLPDREQKSQAEQNVVIAKNLTLQYGSVTALDDVSLALPAHTRIGLIGPDGVGKSSLLALVAGARKLQVGELTVLGGDLKDPKFRGQVSPRIAYMPQGLGKNLYPTLSVYENVDFFAKLFGHNQRERQKRILDLLRSTGLERFKDRPAAKLSGGMKQKLGLCCSLIHDPELLILDEPTTGVDPLSRRQFWELIESIRAKQPDMSVLVATAYMDEVAEFDWLIAMDSGKVLRQGTPSQLVESTNTHSLESAFIAMLPEEKKVGHREVIIPPRDRESTEIAIEAQDLTMRFGNFTAVDRVNFKIEQGEIFGFLGSNGCGKSTTMKILTGLLPASDGKGWLFGQEVDAQDLATRHRVGYMSQSFSLYSELSVRQNLILHAKLFHIPSQEIPDRVDEVAKRFDLVNYIDALPDSLPLGQRQRMSLAVALIHKPDLLILDEPTSGVDPIARDSFWELLVDLSRNDQVTIFISTHFVNEAQRCDRISLMHAGKVLVCDTPDAITKSRGASNLEEAFIGYLAEASEAEEGKVDASEGTTSIPTDFQNAPHQGNVRMTSPMSNHNRVSLNLGFSIQRMLSYSMREALELKRDPIRATLALVGTLVLLVVMGFGIGMDVENLSFAVLDLDQTTSSQNYAFSISGSHYFSEQEPIESYESLDARMQKGNLAVAIELPPGFGRDLQRGDGVEVGAWLDGAMPQRAETVRGYLLGMHSHWLTARSANQTSPHASSPIATGGNFVETRFQYNPDIKSVVAMVPGVIPLLLILFPAMLSALSVVREKELGTITNLYVTPTTRLEFILGKQLPYILIAILNYVLLMVVAIGVFRIPFTGSFLANFVGVVLYLACATGIGLLISSFTKSQIAAIFGTSILTILPATQLSGLIDPINSLEGFSAVFSQAYPTTHYLTISRGTFSKALDFNDLTASYWPMLIAAPLITAASVGLLSKQEK